MKKLIAIICILLVIFIGMYLYQKQEKENIVTAEEVQNIEQYISKIYMWKEVTTEALPVFKNINNAPEKWIWEVVKKNLNNYDEITYEEIEEKAKELFGDGFTNTFPKDGNESFMYNKEQNLYDITNIQIDSDNDTFLLDTIKKTKNGYNVEIIEYIEDYSEEDPENSQIENEQEEEYTIHIKNTQGEEISNTKNSEGKDKIIEKVKENKDQFTKKKIQLEYKIIDGKTNLFIISSI